MANVHKNKLIDALNIKPTEKVISIRENELADANFILTNLMLQFLSEKSNEKNKVCLVIMHNTLGHYHNVGKKIGYDLLKKIQEGYATTIEPLKSLYEHFGSGDSPDVSYLSSNKEDTVKNLFLNINCKIENLLATSSDDNVYLIIDDVSHLLDLGVDVKHVIAFIKYCVGLTSNSQVHIIINCHVCNANDEMISNSLAYSSDVCIDVSNLKTGISRDVTGVLKVTKNVQNNSQQLNQNVYHYKAYDREIRIFAPGESILNLRN